MSCCAGSATRNEVACRGTDEGRSYHGKELYVANLSFKTTEAQLRQFFSTVGEVVRVRVAVVPHTGQPKGFGFVEMATEEEAQQAIRELDGRSFMRRKIAVTIAQKPENN